MKLEPVSIKNHPTLNEKWVQDAIANDPAILGLGDLIVRDKERIHKGAGRLDLLLQDPESLRRYEIELQLGATDAGAIYKIMINSDGYVIVKYLISEKQINDVKESLSKLSINGAGTRNGMLDPIIKKIGLSCQDKLREMGYIKGDYSIISCIIFDKNQDKNWQVPFHRDEFFCFDSKIESQSYSEWCVKEGRTYGKPSAKVLGQIVSLRIAIDDNDENNGPLRIIPGSHLLSEKFGSKDNNSEVEIHLKSGDALVFSPLCLHASSKIKSYQQRRVLHYSWGPSQLPDGAKWSLD